MMCKQCVLDDRFPGIRFDENGVCNFCRSRRAKDEDAQKAKYEARFRDLIGQVQGTSTYDCLVALSGGKDSTYTLHLLSEKYGLHVLAFSFDNWFQSPKTHENIRTVVRHCNVDHLTVMPGFDAFRGILLATLSHDLFPAKSLQRASAICTICLSLIRFAAFRIAIEKKIPFVVFGLSPGQAPLATAIFKTNGPMMKKMQDAVFNPLHRSLGDKVRPFFLDESCFEGEKTFHCVNPLAFNPYSEDLVLATANAMGWEKPQDTDPNSTNCLLNSLANQVHLERYGYNPYAFELATLVREGSLDREAGIRRLREPADAEVIGRIREELGIGLSDRIDKIKQD